MPLQELFLLFLVSGIAHDFRFLEIQAESFANFLYAADRVSQLCLNVSLVSLEKVSGFVASGMKPENMQKRIRQPGNLAGQHHIVEYQLFVPFSKNQFCHFHLLVPVLSYLKKKSIIPA